jgi:magnesium chelatase subunit I
MQSRADALTITEQEAWVSRSTQVEVPQFVREVVEEIAFQARSERKIDKRSGVSQRMPISVLETTISNAERRALANGESPVVPRVTDVYAALPSMTGKFELEYEGELKGADQVARDLVRAAVANVFDAYFDNADTKTIVEWFDLGGSLSLSDTTDAATLVKDAAGVQGLIDLATERAGIDKTAAPPSVASAIDFLLEGLYAQKKISRSDVRGYHGAEPARRPQAPQQRTAVLTPDDDDDPETTRRKKKYYN